MWWPSTSPTFRWPRGGSRLDPREPGQREDVGAPDSAGRGRAARARPGGLRGHRGRRARPQLGARPRGPSGRVDDKQPVFRPISTRLARRGRPRPSGALPPVGEVDREHDHLGDKLAPGRLHRDDSAPSVPGTSAAASSCPRRLTRSCEPHSSRQVRTFTGACPSTKIVPGRAEWL